MINLPAKFNKENRKAPNTPSLIVEVQSGVLASDQTTQTDWQNNTGENNVDYTPDPPSSGDVILASAPVPDEEQTGHNADVSVYSTTGMGGPYYHNVWQSFKQHTSTAKVLNSILIKISTMGGNGSLKCEIWSAGKGGKIGNTVSLSIPYNVTSYGMTFDFSAQGLVLNSDTEYWLKLYVTGIMDGSSLPQCYMRYNTSTSSYGDGQFDYYPSGGPWEYNKGDLYFRVTMTGDYYQSSGYIITQNMDLGETPANEGDWVIEDIQPAGASLAYQAWASDTGAFAGEETNLGAISDGDAITVLKRYYKVRADFSTTNLSNSPTLQRIKAQFEQYDSYADRAALGFEPSIMGVSSLTTQIDDFSKSTISQVDVTLGLTKNISNWLAAKYPRNKIVKVKAGFTAPGWTKADYINYFVGQVEDWSITTGYEAKLQVRDYAKAWKVQVPEKWESTLDDAVWSNMHPVDVCLDILRNRINVRDSKLVVSSFDDVRTALPGWKVSRTITEAPVDADELLQELRLLMSCYFLPQADGRIRIKQWDPDEAAVDALDGDNFFNVNWAANAGSLINLTHIYFAWLGNGDDAADFAEHRGGVDAASITNWGETKVKEIKDKWTLAADLGQIQTLEQTILARYANPPSIISGDVHRLKIYLEVGDMVTVTTRKAPSTDMNGIVDAKYQIVNRNLDHKKDTIRLKLLEV